MNSNKQSLGQMNKKESLIDDCGDINQTVLAVEVRGSDSEGGK